MKIEMIEVTIKDVFEGYKNNGEDGVKGYGGMLNIRPPYQREVIYDDEKQKKLIETIKKGFPLNTMYWVQNNKDGQQYELLDGQQRTMSFCEFLNENKPDEVGNYLHSLTEDARNRILNYKLNIYVCEGNESEKLDWFKTINIAGEKLTNQELRNAMYTGQWLLDAKKKFSKTNCVAEQKGKDYVKCKTIRQELLEKVLKWKVDFEQNEEINTIEKYMSKHQLDKDANDLWQYYVDVIDWATKLFPVTPQNKKWILNQEWGLLYNTYHNEVYNIDEINKKFDDLLKDSEVDNKKGIVQYLLSKKEKYLNLRVFDDAQKTIAYNHQNGICPICGEHFEYNEMEGDHIVPWSKGGKTTQENCQMLCKRCNREKSGK